MRLKVDPEELLDVSNVIKKDADQYDKEIDNMEACLEKLKLIWQGYDAKAFTDNLTNFLTRMKGIPESLKTLSSLCSKSSEGYSTRDEEFARKLKEDALKEDETKEGEV